MNQDIRLSREIRAAAIVRLSEAARLAQAASDQQDEAFADFLGINRTDARCLDLIDQLGPLTAGRLAETSGLTTGAVTTVVDRLEAAGYVQRSRDGADRRKVYIEATATARQLGADAYEPFKQRWAQALEQFDDDDLLAVVAYLETARALSLEHASLIRSRVSKRGVPLRYRLEQARGIKTDAKKLWKEVKSQIKDTASIVQALGEELTRSRGSWQQDDSGAWIRVQEQQSD